VRCGLHLLQLELAQPAVLDARIAERLDEREELQAFPHLS
jgi:hypothetical protein